MMRRIDLLPASYAERRRQRRAIGSVALAGGVVFLLLVAWWILLGTQISGERDHLTEVQADNRDLQAQIDELSRFAQLEQEVRRRQVALQTAMAGDVDWPAVLTEVAMVVPGEVWLTNMTASAGQTEGATPVGTEAAPIDVESDESFGRVQFQGKSLTMPGIGKWLVRLETVKEFQAVWLNSASEQDSEGNVPVVEFDSTLEFNDEAASLRFQDGAP